MFRKTYIPYLATGLGLGLLLLAGCTCDKMKPAETLEKPGPETHVTIEASPSPTTSVSPTPSPATSSSNKTEVKSTSIAKKKLAPKLRSQVPNDVVPEAIPAIEAPAVLEGEEPSAEATQEGQVGFVPTPSEELEVPRARSTLEANFLAAHAPNIGPDGRSFSEFLVEGKYHFNETHSVGIGQSAQKLYEIAEYEGEKEFLLRDTHLFYDYVISPNYLSSKWAVEIDSTIPVSKDSQDRKVVTLSTVSLRYSKAMLGGRLVLQASPSLGYQFNQYATDNSGKPLQRVIFGSSVEAKYYLMPEKLSLGVWGKGYYRTYEEFDYAKVTPEATTSFGIGTYLGYTITKNILLQGGVMRGSSVLTDIRYDSSFYDPEATRAYVALQFSL